MAYKTILAILDSTKNTAQVTNFAIALARKHEAHLIGLHAEAVSSVPIVAPMEIPDPVTLQALQDMAHAETRDIETGFCQLAEREGISCEWRSFITTAGYATSSISETVRSADLVIAGQPDPDSTGNSRADLEQILFDAGRPVMIVPYIYREPQPIRRALIAWNGSREAARAVFDALPLLKAATEVEILTAGPAEEPSETPSVPGGDIAASLARHGVKVTIVSGETNGLSAAAVIENRLSDSSIDLLVMGAYSHSRIWETLFGGVTRTLLDSMSAVTLLSR